MLNKIKKKVFIIAEIGINHNGKLEQAKKLINAASKSGANAVKFQTYKTEKRVKKNSPIFDILKECELNEKKFKILKGYADKKKILFFSTPFDNESTDFLIKDLKVKLIKIASFDTSNFELINNIIKHKIDVIMSLGLSNINQIKKNINKINNKTNLGLLHCVTSYPLDEYDANLSCINKLQKLFPKNIIGYSDHTKGFDISNLAVACGAKIIEKHFMINKNDKCPDKAVSLDSYNFKKMVLKIRETEKILGDDIISVRKIEKKFLQFKRTKI